MITRTPFVEQPDGSLVCTVTISADEIGRLLVSGLQSVPVLSAPSAPSVPFAPSAIPPQRVGMVGTDVAQMMLAPSKPAMSLDALARYAPFQRFVEEQFGLAEDSYVQAVEVLRGYEHRPAEELERFLDRYAQWHAQQSFAHEPVFP